MPVMEFSEKTKMSIRCAADIIRNSRRGVVLTGAGISTPSGIPDFRSPESGLWEKFDPLEVASLSSFRHDPARFYNWMHELASTIINAKPNPAHISVSHLQELGYAQTIITQNIDALHQRSGAKNVLEVHGSFRQLTCTQCFIQYDSHPFLENYLQNGTIPTCPSCGGVLKPDLILMGEQLPVRIWLKAQEACRECDMMLVAGSSLEVLPVAGLPMRALENGAHLILINFSPTYLDVRADVVLHENVADVLPSIVEMVEAGK